MRAAEQSTAHTDDGFTLIELLIAMTVMTIAVVVLVSAMSTVVVASSQHRGHSIEESLARNYAEAVQQKADFRTPLAAAVTGTDPALTVADSAGFQATAPFYVVVDQETMQVTKVSGNSLTVTRNVGGTQSAHPQGASVVPLQRCPVASGATVDGNLTPSAFDQPAEASAAIAAVEYWDPATQSFTSDRNICTSHFDLICPSDIRPECDVGLERVQIHIAVEPDASARYKGVATDTQVIVRRGSS
ncbi:MAG: prepilin-type N-terminal cleavage/methylation domain-containing protein [Actinomycetes bacterium]